MEYKDFRGTWGAIYLWAHSLEEQLTGRPLVRAYTHRKSELVLHFTRGDELSALSWVARGNQAQLAYFEKATLPKKRVEIFPSIDGTSILHTIQIHTRDRALKFNFRDGHTLIMGFYPAILNVHFRSDGSHSELFLGSPSLSGSLTDEWIGMNDVLPESIPGKLNHTLLANALDAIRVSDSGELEFGMGSEGEVTNIIHLERSIASRVKTPAVQKNSLQRLIKQAGTLGGRWKTKLKRLKQELLDAHAWPELESQLNDLRMALAMDLEVLDGHVDIPADLSSTGVDKRITLGQHQNILEAIESHAKKIRKAKAKLDQLGPMITSTEKELDSLQAILAAPDADELHDFLQRHGEIMDPSGKQSSERKPYKRSQAPSGADILVGRSSRDNDTLTFKVAAKNDWWFHARGVRGSHVILRTGRSEPSQADIQRAAELAALNSKAKHSGIVVVQYCQRKHLTKPRGSAPGAVLVHHEKSITVDLDQLERS